MEDIGHHISRIINNNFFCYLAEENILYDRFNLVYGDIYEQYYNHNKAYFHLFKLDFQYQYYIKKIYNVAHDMKSNVFDSGVARHIVGNIIRMIVLYKKGVDLKKLIACIENFNIDTLDNNLLYALCVMIVLDYWK